MYLTSGDGCWLAAGLDGALPSCGWRTWRGLELDGIGSGNGIETVVAMSTARLELSLSLSCNLAVLQQSTRHIQDPPTTRLSSFIPERRTISHRLTGDLLPLGRKRRGMSLEFELELLAEDVPHQRGVH